MAAPRRSGVAVMLAAAVVTLPACAAFEPNSQSYDPPAQCAVEIADDGWYRLRPEQAVNAATISAVAFGRGLPARASTIGIATAMQESSLINLDYGDRDSKGLFQQRPSQGWGTDEQVQDPIYASNAFYDALVKVPDYESMEITVAAQTVQRSAYPDAYAKHENTARAWASSLTGNSPAALTCFNIARGDLPADGSAEQLAALIARDFGTALPVAVQSAAADAAAEPKALTVDISPLAAALGRESQLTSWAVAQWLVATSATTGAMSVTVDGWHWNLDDQWTAAEADTTMIGGGAGSPTVLVELA